MTSKMKICFCSYLPVYTYTHTHTHTQYRLLFIWGKDLVFGCLIFLRSMNYVFYPWIYFIFKNGTA